jgi:hypothetical protein
VSWGVEGEGDVGVNRGGQGWRGRGGWQGEGLGDGGRGMNCVDERRREGSRGSAG